MKLQGTILIPDTKLTQYLLVPKARNDKSQFLVQVGFTAVNPEDLKKAILALVYTYEAQLDSENEYGTFYLVEGKLSGLSDRLTVVTVWLARIADDITQFITFKPSKR